MTLLDNAKQLLEVAEAQHQQHHDRSRKLFGFSLRKAEREPAPSLQPYVDTWSFLSSLDLDELKALESLIALGLESMADRSNYAAYLRTDGLEFRTKTQAVAFIAAQAERLTEALRLGIDQLEREPANFRMAV